MSAQAKPKVKQINGTWVPDASVASSAAGPYPSLPADLPDTSHTGASNNLRDMTMWQPQNRSADAAILPELDKLVGRARDMDRNSGVAKGGIQTLVDNVVGVGLRLISRPNFVAMGRTKSWAVGWAREYESLYYEWWWSTACHAGDTMTGDHLTAQVFRSSILSGDWLALPLWLPNRGDGFATKLQTVESDRLCNPNGAPNTSELRGGIKYDQYSMPVGAYIRKTHPGDYGVIQEQAGDYGKWEYIPRKTPWGRKRWLHGFDPDRPGQSRGKPLLSPVLSQFKQADRYTNAEIAAAVANAMIAGIIYTDLDQDAIVELFRNNEQHYLEERLKYGDVKLQSGSMIPVFPGDKVEPFIPSRPAAQFGAFMTNVYRIIAVGMDMSYELLMKDFSNLNYSSARSMMLEIWRGFNRRRDWLGTQWMDEVNLLFMEEVVNDGRLDAPDFYRYKGAYCRAFYIGPGKGWVDPVKEITAAQMRIDIGLSTLEKECAEQGEDWREIMAQQAYEQEERARLGIQSPAAKPAAGAAPADGANPADDQQQDEPPTRQRDPAQAAAGATTRQLMDAVIMADMTRDIDHE